MRRHMAVRKTGVVMLTGIGDNLNDLQILETAGYSACPGDGHPGIFSVVDYIACPALEGAVADVCEHFLFEKDN